MLETSSCNSCVTIISRRITSMCSRMGKSPVSLAFLNEHSDAEYIFYKDYPKQRLDVLFPPINEDDIIVIGSYYALNPVLRDKILELLDIAREKKAIVYYDPNFRSSHKNEAMKLAPTIIENLEYADIVRGSLEDFYYMYGIKDAEKIYKDKTSSIVLLFLVQPEQKKLAAYQHSIERVSCHPVASSQYHRCRRQLQCRPDLRHVKI